MLDANSQEVREFLEAWHENGRAQFNRLYANLDYDSDRYRKHAHNRSKYIACDNGTSGAFLVDRLTHDVFSINGYGVKAYFCGTLESLTMRYKEATDHNRTIEGKHAMAVRQDAQ